VPSTVPQLPPPGRNCTEDLYQHKGEEPRAVAAAAGEEKEEEEEGNSNPESLKTSTIKTQNIRLKARYFSSIKS